MPPREKGPYEEKNPSVVSVTLGPSVGFLIAKDPAADPEPRGTSMTVCCTKTPMTIPDIKGPSDASRNGRTR